MLVGVGRERLTEVPSALRALECPTWTTSGPETPPPRCPQSTPLSILNEKAKHKMDANEAMKIIIRHQRRVEEEARARGAKVGVDAGVGVGLRGAVSGEGLSAAAAATAAGAATEAAALRTQSFASASNPLSSSSTSPTKAKPEEAAKIAAALKALSAIQAERAATYRLWSTATETLLESGSIGLGTSHLIRQ